MVLGLPSTGVMGQVYSAVLRDTSMPSAPDVVLLHGALGASTQLEPLARLLAPPFRIHRLDFEGHGEAASRGRPFRIAHFVKDVLEVLDERGIPTAHIFGYSLGGYVALALALDHPDRINRIATLGTKFVWDPPTAEKEATRLDAAKVRAKVPQFAETLAARHERAGGWESVLARTAEFLRALGDAPVLTPERLSQIPHSVRVMVGDRDSTVSVAESESSARNLGAGELVVLRDTPHPIEQVDAQRLASVLRAFFSEVSR